jgi:hypothetical protein
MNDKYREIVGAQIGTTITNDKTKIAEAIEANRTDIQFLDRLQMQLMSSCDLGINWDNMANGPTLFCMDGKGKPYAATANNGS